MNARILLGCIVLFVACAVGVERHFALAQDAKASIGQRWEYKTCFTDQNGHNLNYYGNEGWELVSVTYDTRIQGPVAYFKRPK